MFEQFRRAIGFIHYTEYLDLYQKEYNTTLDLKKIARKCLLFLNSFHFFSYGKIKDIFFWIRIKFLLGRSKGRGKRGYGEEAQNEGYFCKIPLLSKIKSLSHKLLVRQTSNNCHCNWHAQKATCRDFQVISSSSSWSKTTLSIFKEQIWLTNRKYYGKNKLCFDSLSQWREALSSSFSLNILCR